MKPLNILLVDDDAEIARFIKLKLSREAPHFSIVSVESGHECLDYLKAHAVDCILTDYQMPGMDGMELLLTLRGRGSDVPVIFVTGQGNEEVAREAFKNGAYDYFTKDIGFAHFARIINSIEQAVRHRETEKAIKERDFWINESQRVARLGSYVVHIPTGECAGSDILDEIFGVAGNYVDIDGWINIIHPDERDRMAKYYADVIAEKKRFEAEYRIIRRSDGQERWVYGLGELIFDQAGNPVKMLGTIQDITERKQMEETLLLERNKFNSIIDSIQENITIHDTDCRIIYQNKAAIKRLGAHSGEFCYKAYHQQDNVCDSCQFKQLLIDKQAHKSTRRGFRDGREIFYEMVSYPLLNSKGDIIAGVELVFDITERKKAEELLLESEKKMRAIIDNIPDLAWLKDTEGRFIAVNKPFADSCGLSSDDIVGKTDLDVWSEELAERYRTDDWDVMKFGRRKQLEEPVIDKVGYQTWVETIKTPVYNEKGEVSGTIGIARDITDRKKLDKQKAEFYAMLTHDLKSPLCIISGYAELLAGMSDRSGTDAGAMIKSIRNNSIKLTHLVDDFLSISKMDNGTLALNISVSPIGQILKELYAGFEEVFRKKGLVFNIEIPDALQAVAVDHKLIRRAVANLLQNAADYTPPGGSINLTAKTDAEDGRTVLVISVTDTGCGIPVEEQDRIFEKYYRSPSTDGITGTGLGLAIVKAIAEAHGGRVEVRSEPEKGSTFKLILPLNPQLSMVGE